MIQYSLQVRDIAAAEIHYAGGIHHARKYTEQAGDTCNMQGRKRSAEYIYIINY